MTAYVSHISNDINNGRNNLYILYLLYYMYIMGTRCSIQQDNIINLESKIHGIKTFPFIACLASTGIGIHMYRYMIHCYFHAHYTFKIMMQ